MAFTEFYVATTGSNLNSGSPNTGGVYPLTYAGGTWVAGTGVFTVASGDPAADGVTVGDFVSVYTTAGATVATFVGRVTARNSTTITASLTAISGSAAAPSAGAGATTAKVGGAWAGPSGTTAFPFNFAAAAMTDASANPVNVNFAAGTWNSTANWTHTLTGPVRFTGTLDGSNQPTSIIQGDSGAASYVLLTISGTNTSISNFHFDENGTGTTGASLVTLSGTNGEVTRCRFTNAQRDGMLVSGGGAIITECEAHSCNLSDSSDFGGFQATEESTWVRCIAHHNDVAPTHSAVGFTIATGSGEPLTMIDCIFAANGKHGANAPGGSVSATFIGCVFANNGESGINQIANASTLLKFENCIFSDNGDYGIEFFSAVGRVSARNCGFYSNGIAPTLNVNASFLTGTITFSAVPFDDVVNGDFDLNNTATGGADARNAGVGTFLIDSNIYSGTTLGYPSLGASEPDAAAPGGGQTSYTFG